MDILKSLGFRFFYFYNRPVTTRYIATLLDDKSTWDVKSWTAVNLLLSRPYWSRLWVIQEIPLGGNMVSVICGTRTVGWHLFLFFAANAISQKMEMVVEAVASDYESMAVLELPTSALLRIDRIQRLGVFADLKARGLDKVGLNQLFDTMRYAEATDPRDKVYGILSLVDQELSDLITPKYSLAPDKVFTKFAKAVIYREKKLDIIVSQGLPKPGQSSLHGYRLDRSSRHGRANDTESHVSSKQKLVTRDLIIDCVDGLSCRWSIEAMSNPSRSLSNLRVVSIPTGMKLGYKKLFGVRYV